MRHCGTKNLRTSRLFLRPMTVEDAIPMFETWASDPAVTRFLRWEPHKSWADTAQLLAAWQELYANPDYYQWSICLAESGTLIGSISVQQSEEFSNDAWQERALAFSEGVWEPGYCIGRAFWGRGYTTEALCAVRDFWFEQVGGSWLSCCHATANPASGRVMQKAGWHYDHQAVYHKFDGSPVACRVYYLKNPNI